MNSRTNTGMIAGEVSLLNYGLALIVMFIGVKMLIMGFYKIPIPWMLGTVFTILAVSIAASLLRPPGDARKGDGAR